MRERCVHRCGGQCAALEVRACGGLSCRFFRTEAERAEEVRAWRARLRILPAAQQRAIAEKYYGGTAPWRK